MTENVAIAVLNHPVIGVVQKITKACNEAKGRDLVILDVSKISDLSQYFVIVSGRSDRHVQGISNRILDMLKTEGVEPLSIEGIDDAHWVLIDTGDVVFHVFYESTRERYDLEGLWATAQKVQPKGMDQIAPQAA